MEKRILIAEDDLDILNLVKDYLKASNYETEYSQNGEEAYTLFQNKSIDLAILDLMLPGVDGFELCRRIRQESNIPIIILSAKKSDSDKILALGLGADDYIVKPFSPRELIARIKSIFRRVDELSDQTSSKDFIEINDLVIDTLGRSVTLQEKRIDLSVKEYDILLFLINHSNQALSREKIFNKVWGYENYGDINTVTVHVRKLREKIEEDPSNPKYIETVWGIGYKFIK
ncbi:MAG TPA: response regulator transcription factor [Clostridia bacterium]|nr:response regulator transcription factor [Clostridia bacterium]